MAGNFEDLSKALQKVYNADVFAREINQQSPFTKIFSIEVPPLSTFEVLVPLAVSKLKPPKGCKWDLAADGLPFCKPPRYYNEGIAEGKFGCWVKCVSSSGGVSETFVKIKTEEVEGEFILKAGLW